MSNALAVSALGAVMQLEFGDEVPADVVTRIRRAWSGAAVEATEPPDLHLEVTRVSDPERYLEHLSTAVTLDALAHARGRLMMLHAAGIALEDGRVIAFTGPSGRGKTTLSRVLAGLHGYVSDETIAFDRDLRVLPYRKPLSVVREGLPKDQVAPEDAGLRPLPEGELRLAAIVLLDRDPSVGAPVVEHLHFLDAAPELVEQTSYLAEIHGTIATLAELCERVGGIRRIRYSEASDVPAVIDALLARDPEPEEWEHVVLDVADADGGVVAVDAVDYGDALMVLSDRTLRVLTGIAPTIVRAAGAGDDFESLVRAVVEVHGTPPSGDADALVRAALDELVDAGVVPAR